MHTWFIEQNCFEIKQLDMVLNTLFKFGRICLLQANGQMKYVKSDEKSTTYKQNTHTHTRTQFARFCLKCGGSCTVEIGVRFHIEFRGIHFIENVISFV